MARSIQEQIELALEPTRRKLESVERAVGAQDARDLGNQVTAKIKSLVTKGISPLDTGARLPAYLGAGDPKRYPASVRGSYPGKRARPVNLTLSGKFLNSLQVQVNSNRGGYSPTIGYFDSLSKLKEQGHREGAGGQPSRATIPQNGISGFSVTIQKLISDFYLKAVKAYLGGGSNAP